MGLYPPGTGEKYAIPEDLGVAQPPFKVRDSKQISEKLGQDQALPFGYIGAPAYNFEKFDINSFRTDSCALLDEAYWADLALLPFKPEILAQWGDLIERLKVPISAALDIPEEIMQKANLKEIEYFSDVLQCKYDEGLTMEPWLFTDELW